MSRQTDFINSIKNGAIEGQKKYGVYASVTIAQAIWETGWGQSKLVRTDKNLFGIKFPGNHGVPVTRGSWATDDGGYYAKYQSLNDSVIDHGYFLRHNPIYSEHGVFKKGITANEQIKAIMASGYASNPYDKEAISIMKDYNLYQYDKGGIGGGGSSDEEEQKKINAIINKAVEWAIKIANDDSHGYDQNNRWGSPDYDCSSFVISAYEQAGLKLKENGASYTGDMEQAFNKCGFKSIKWSGDVSSLKKGDVLLNTVHHTAMYIGNGKIVQASINELGHATGGKPGDQTGKEIYIRDFYNYPWDLVLRLGVGSSEQGGSEQGGSEQGGSGQGSSEEVWKKILKTSYNTKCLNDEEITFLKTLSFGDKVKIKQTFNKNKKVLGYNNFRNKLTFSNYTFIIKDVKNNGLIILYVVNGYKNNNFYINPKYLRKV